MILNKIVEDYQDMWLNLKFEFLKNYRQKRFLIISIITVVIPSLFYFIPKLSETDVAENIDSFLSTIMGFTELILILCAIFFGADAINSERYHKTSLIVFTLPQRRTSIFVGKYLAQLLASWIMVSLYYISTVLFATIEWGFDELPMENIIKSILFAYLYMSAILSIAFILSSIVRSPSISMMLTFFTLFMFMPITSLLLGIADIETTMLITNYSSLITEIFRFPGGGLPSPGGGSGDFTIEKGMDLSLGYTIVLGALSWYINNKKEA